MLRARAFVMSLLLISGLNLSAKDKDKDKESPGDAVVRLRQPAGCYSLVLSLMLRPGKLKPFLSLLYPRTGWTRPSGVPCKPDFGLLGRRPAAQR
jgi:hypothetical protein